jgi:periplasmic divalent cation tolerance protein
MKNRKHAIVLITAPDKKTARAVVKTALDKKLAAAGQIISQIDSVYRWLGKINNKKESLILLIAPAQNFKEIEKEIKKIHPYKVAQIISLDINQTSKDYAAWIKSSSNRF